MKKRLVIIHPHFVLPGGAGRYALETGLELSKRDWDVHIVSIRHEPHIVAGYERLTFHSIGGPLSSSIWHWARLPWVILQVIKIIDSLSPSLVFSQVFPANWWVFCAKALRGDALNHVWMCQEPSAFIHSKKWLKALPNNAAGIGARALNPVLRPLDVFLSRFVDYVFVNSLFTRDLARAAYRYPLNKLGISYPGVELTKFKPDAMLPVKKFQFVACGRLTKFKNVDQTLRALSRVKHPQAHLSVIGSGEEYENLVSLAQTLGISNRITFQKTVTDKEMVATLCSSFALIHAAEEEPFGLVPVEAMACGTPVIAIKGGGPAETVIHQKTGYLCESAREDDIAQAIHWMIDNNINYNDMRQACVQRAKDFEWKRAVDSLEPVFERLIGKRSRQDDELC